MAAKRVVEGGEGKCPSPLVTQPTTANRWETETQLNHSKAACEKQLLHSDTVQLDSTAQIHYLSNKLVDQMLSTAGTRKFSLLMVLCSTLFSQIILSF